MGCSNTKQRNDNQTEADKTLLQQKAGKDTKTEGASVAMPVKFVQGPSDAEQERARPAIISENECEVTFPIAWVSVRGRDPLPDTGTTTWRMSFSNGGFWPGVCDDRFANWGPSVKPEEGSWRVSASEGRWWAEGEQLGNSLHESFANWGATQGAARVYEFVFDADKRTLGLRLNGKDCAPFPAWTDLPAGKIYPLISGGENVKVKSDLATETLEDAPRLESEKLEDVPEQAVEKVEASPAKDGVTPADISVVEVETRTAACC